VHAQGTSQAFEDALELGHRLAVQGLNPDALRQYEATRTPRVVALQEYEKQNARTLMEGEMLDQIFGKEFEPLKAVE
jgi:2-polyprenyl-6-methoxyphenol hydroxylase-like FAD-dependent oxidoreductase